MSVYALICGDYAVRTLSYLQQVCCILTTYSYLDHILIFWSYVVRMLSYLQQAKILKSHLHSYNIHIFGSYIDIWEI